MKRTLIFLLLWMLPAVAFAQQADPRSTSTHYMGALMDIARRMMADKVPLLLRLGWIEATIIAGIVWLFFLLKTAFGARRHSMFDLEGAMHLIGRMMFVVILLSGYSFWSALPATFASGLADYVGQGQVDNLVGKSTALLTGMEKPNPFNLVEVFFYLQMNVGMGTVGLVVFALYSSVFQTIGVAVIYGPLFIPLLLTRAFERWFFRWVDIMIAAAMMIPTISIFMYFWSNFLMNAFDQLFGTDISLGRFAVTFIVTIILLIGGLVLGALKLGSTHSDLFSGSGSVGSGLVAGWDSVVRGATAKLKGK